MKKRKKIFQAGHACSAGFNSWDIVAFGETIEQARQKLKELKQKTGKPEEFFGRYVETYFFEDQWGQ